MEAVATGAAANVTSEAAKGIFVEAKRHIQYVIFYKKNVDKFEEKLRTLIAKRTSVQKEVDAATRNVQKIKADVEEWCNRVDEKIEEEKKKVEDLQDRAKNKCFIGLCPPIKSRYQLSRGAEKGVTTFQELISERGQLSTAVGYLDVPEDIEEDEPPKDFLAFESREKVFNDVMQAVRDTSISMLGVYGMGSVGKTTLLEEVVRQAKKDKLFEWVVMVPITQNPVILTIQDQIAELLGLKLEDKTVEVRAHRLRQRFKEEKKKKEEKQKKEQKFLLVLDDLWAELDLTKVGIPFGDEESPCKMMLSSRDQNVLLQFEGMYAHNSFQIGLLDYKETLHLFKKIIGESNQSSMSELQTEGNEIAERCGGLPVAISAVAKTLRNQPPSAWRDALKQLQSPSSGGLNDISPAVYTALKWSYNHIKGEKVKRFFLFCNMLSHNTLIEDLLKYSIGLGFFPGDYKVEEARDRMLTWVSNLKASGLLLNSYSDDRFDIHDVISNVAISIASTEDNQLLPLKQEDVLKDWPDEETMKHRSWINLRVANNTVLPDVVECPQLSFLQISGQETKMPPYFLKEMKKLQVLDLTVMDLSSFPSSIGLLSSLQTLCLDYSILGDITVVGELKTLEILSLRNSYIQRLPEEIGQLFRLRMLDLRGCTKKIPPGLLSKLTKLEELYIGESFDKWEAAADANQRGNASFSELSSLSRLTTLEVHIRDAQMVLGNFSFIQKLKRYKIFMGKEWLHDWYFYDYKCSRTLILRSTSINHLHHEIKMIMERTEYLHLEGLEDVDNATETDEEVSTFTSTTEQQCLLRFGEK
ncbi:Disease resistance protein, partial [Corchorus olitorius]